VRFQNLLATRHMGLVRVRTEEIIAWAAHGIQPVARYGQSNRTNVPVLSRRP
jgi:hypothetical protein